MSTIAIYDKVRQGLEALPRLQGLIGFCSEAPIASVGALSVEDPEGHGAALHDTAAVAHGHGAV